MPIDGNIFGARPFTVSIGNTRMGAGVRVDVRFRSPPSCPVTDAATAAGGTGRAVSRSVDPEEDRVIEQFVLDAPDEEEDGDLDRLEIPIESVFSCGPRDVYRFEREPGGRCPCASIEAFGHPITNVEATDGGLLVTFYVSELDAVRSVLSDLRSEYAGMAVERIVRSEAAGSDADLVHVDRDVLTDRQVEVLRTAIQMGYFEHPRGANAGEVAERLDINRATFAEHLRAAQRKLLPTIVGE